MTDFFVVGPDQAESLMAADPVPDEVPQVLAKSVDTVKIGTLFRVASDGKGQVEDVDDPVDVDRPDGPWLVVIRDEVTRVIAGIAEDQLQGVAHAWAATEEWQLDNGDPEFLGSLVGQLRDLARKAGTSTERLYLRMSL